MAVHSGCSLGQILEISENSPQIQSMDKGEYFLQTKTVTAYGVNRMNDYEGEDIGIRKIRIRYMVDVKYELK